MLLRALLIRVALYVPLQCLYALLCKCASRHAALCAALNTARYCNMVLGSPLAACTDGTRCRAAARSSANDSKAATSSERCGGQSATDGEVRTHGTMAAAETQSVVSQNHRVHNVLQLVNRTTIVKWMLEKVRDRDEKHFCSNMCQSSLSSLSDLIVGTACGPWGCGDIDLGL